jgi:hypothetical protein
VEQGGAVLWKDAIAAAAAAALLSGIPSTLYAWWTGADPMEATRAAGAMLIPAGSGGRALFLAAALVHGALSLFWALLFAWLLPRRHTVAWAIAASGAIALLDLRIIARVFFPEVYALAFWPQLADHLAFGASAGAVLAWRRRGRLAARP